MCLLEEARDIGLRPSTFRDIACRTLGRFPNQDNWSEYPNIWEEVRELVDSCPWYRVYDLIEAVVTHLTRYGTDSGTPSSPDDGSPAEVFSSLMNECLEESNVAWHVVDGEVRVRGTAMFEAQVERADAALGDLEAATARRELDEALKDLSRRPNPDLTGAVQHAMAAMECLAREVTGSEKATLGEIIKKTDLLPRPVDDAVAKMWGYASQVARHVAEGSDVSTEEAELAVGLAATVVSYLAAKSQGS